MPIRSEYRWLYPIDWKQLSAVIRFERAKGQCQGCAAPPTSLRLLIQQVFKPIVLEIGLPPRRTIRASSL
jgi:hypothetical protein